MFLISSFFCVVGLVGVLVTADHLEKIPSTKVIGIDLGSRFITAACGTASGIVPLTAVEGDKTYQLFMESKKLRHLCQVEETCVQSVHGTGHADLGAYTDEEASAIFRNALQRIESVVENQTGVVADTFLITIPQHFNKDMWFLIEDVANELFPPRRARDFEIISYGRAVWATHRFDKCLTTEASRPYREGSEVLRAITILFDRAALEMSLLEMECLAHDIFLRRTYRESSWDQLQYEASLHRETNCTDHVSLDKYVDDFYTEVAKYLKSEVHSSAQPIEKIFLSGDTGETCLSMLSDVLVSKEGYGYGIPVAKSPDPLFAGSIGAVAMGKVIEENPDRYRPQVQYIDVDPYHSGHDEL